MLGCPEFFLRFMVEGSEYRPAELVGETQGAQVIIVASLYHTAGSATGGASDARPRSWGPQSVAVGIASVEAQ